MGKNELNLMNIWRCKAKVQEFSTNQDIKHDIQAVAAPNLMFIKAHYEAIIMHPSASDFSRY